MIDWVPGHSGIPGNENADELARTASSLQRSGQPRAIQWSYSLIKYRLNKRMETLHKQWWNERDDCRQTKMFVTEPSKKRTKYLLSLKRTELRSLVGIMTGHNYLNSHMKNMRVVGSPTCLKCLEEDETAEHFLCSCPAYSSTRLRTVGEWTIDPNVICRINLRDVLSFIKKTKRLEH